MAIGVYFYPATMNKVQYDQAIHLLEQAGQGSPKGRLHHSCFGEGEHLMVFLIYGTRKRTSRSSVRHSFQSSRRSHWTLESQKSCRS